MKSPAPLTRRHFLGHAASVVVACSFVPGLGQAQGAKARLKFAVIGINHEHVFRMVQAVREGGGELAMIFAPDMDPNHGAKFLHENSSVKVAAENPKSSRHRTSRLSSPRRSPLNGPRRLCVPCAQGRSCWRTRVASFPSSSLMT